MERETIEMGKTHPEWNKKYSTISNLMENQAAELRTLYRRVLKMRYETSLLGIKYLKATQLLHQIKEESETLEAQGSELPI